MVRTLKKQSLKRLLPYILICAVVAVLLIAISLQAVILHTSGGKTIDTCANRLPADSEYVSFDASQVIVAIASLSTSSDAGKTVLETYYLLPVGDNQYMCVVDHKEKNESVLTRAMDQSREYYLGDLQKLTPIGNLYGTVSPLEDGMESYMTKCIEEYNLPGMDSANSASALIYPYQIDLQKVGFMPWPLALVLFLIGCGFVVIFGLLLIPVICGVYQKKACAVVYQDHTVLEVEKLFFDAAEIERARVGEYIWYPSSVRSEAVATDRIVWGYVMPEPLVVSKYRWQVAIYDREQRLLKVQFEEKKNAQRFLDAIAAQGKPFVNGYSVQNAELFKKDFDEFLELADKNCGE